MVKKFWILEKGGICHKIFTYTYTELFWKIHLAVPACCTGLYTEHFSNEHAD